MKLILQGYEYPNAPDSFDDYFQELEYLDMIDYHEAEWWDLTTPPYWAEAQVVPF